MLALLALLAPTAASNFTAGEVCSAANSSGLAGDMLRGKHLIIAELEWSPYASKQPLAPKGWVGLNIDLYDTVSESLGFTYEIWDMGYPVGDEGWTGLLLRSIDSADLIGCWWAHGEIRNNNVMMLRGHIDTSTSLVGLMRMAEPDASQKFRESFYSFLLPFHSSLWLAILVLVVLSGVVDFIVESRRLPGETKLTASLYEYFAGVLWGGFEYPLSRTSAVYQIILGFFMLVFISSYTANLAAFITVSAVPTASVDGMDSAVFNRQALCLVDYTAGGSLTNKVLRLYPQVALGQNDATSWGLYDAAERLLNVDGCEGLLVPRTDYDGWKANPTYCNFVLSREPSDHASGPSPRLPRPSRLA